jgi:2-succinyl-5-enolpyruvyl-6-hydroxy-3-cyclohexene-1-carboxylate synthase
MSDATSQARRANVEATRAVVETLVAGGVQDFVVSPGSRSTPLVLAIAEAERAGRAEVHVVLDERCAAFFALGRARAHDHARPVALVATSGSAGAHYLPAVVEARETGLPLVLLTADRPPELLHAGAAQTTAQDALFGAHVALADVLPVPDGVVSPRTFARRAARALAHALGPRPAPVHLDLPFREPLWSPVSEAMNADAAVVRVRSGRRVLAPDDAHELARGLRAAERGVILSGPWSPSAQVGRTALADALTEASRALGWPVLVEAGGVEPRDAGCAVTRYDAIARAPALRAALAPRALVRVGRALASKPLGAWLDEATRGHAVLVDAGGETIDPGQTAAELVAAEPADVLLALAHAARGLGPAAESLAAWRAAEADAERHVARLVDADGPLWEAQIARVVADALRAGDRLQLGNGMPIRDFDAFAARRGRGVTIHTARGVNGIDGTLASAIGALPPGARGVAVLGDLATLHDLSGLRLLRDRGPELTVVVVDNRGGGVFDFLPVAADAAHYQRLFRTPQPDDLEALARGVGLSVVRAETRAALAHVLAPPMRPVGPRLVRVPVDPAHNVDRHRTVWNELAAELDAGARP